MAMLNPAVNCRAIVKSPCGRNTNWLFHIIRVNEPPNKKCPNSEPQTGKSRYCY